MTALPWRPHRITIVLGTGGVGKTSVSAALGIEAAMRGQKTLVMTIDPAKRLGNALGLKDLDHHPHTLPEGMFEKFQLPKLRSLDVVMPDVKETLDTLINEASPNPLIAEKILQHPMYQHFSQSLVGANEYAAVQQLYSAFNDSQYDQIILDTPPAQNALSFIDAPERILAFLEQGLPKWLLSEKNTLSQRLFDLSAQLILKGLKHIAGSQTIEELGDFLVLLQDLYGVFAKRSKAVLTLLQSPEAGFLWVTSPHPSQIGAAMHFQEELASHQIHLDGILVNRQHFPREDLLFQEKADAALQHLSKSLDLGAKEQLRAILEDSFHRSDEEQQHVERLRRLYQQPIATIQEVPYHVTDDRERLASMVKNIL